MQDSLDSTKPNQISDLANYDNEDESPTQDGIASAKPKNMENYIDDIDQIIMVNFDQSGSMRADLNGNITEPNEGFSRFTIATQYFTSFTNKLIGYRLKCCLGLISFNNESNLRYPLSRLSDDFEEKGLSSIFPSSTSRLWDSILASCDEIVRFRKDSEGNEKYKNAISRILVITDGEDYKSKHRVEDVVGCLIHNKIIVDCVIISEKDEYKMLAAVCHATGGFSFKPKDINEGLSIFENSAFVNIHERKILIKPLIKDQRNIVPSKLRVECITTDFMNSVKDETEFDSEIINIHLFQANMRSNLLTPLKYIESNRNRISLNRTPLNTRISLIMKELHFAAQINDISDDLNLFVSNWMADKWKVFLKAPNESLYANKWWFLFVTFPDVYPNEPPLIRFISVPYHLNV